MSLVLTKDTCKHDWARTFKERQVKVNFIVMGMSRIFIWNGEILVYQVSEKSQHFVFRVLLRQCLFPEHLQSFDDLEKYSGITL